MRWFLLVCLLAGCRQIFGLEDPQLVDAASPDTSSRPDVMIDGVMFAGCSSDSNLVACYDFEGNVSDGAPAANSTTATNVSFFPGKQGDAISLDASSRVTITDSVLLDVPSVTIEAWVLPKVLPSGTTRAGILDVDGQYAIFIVGGGTVECVGGGTLTSQSPLSAGTWSHVACSIGGGTAKLYINGSPVASLTMASTLQTAAMNGGEVGGNAPDGADRLMGFIDLLRVYRTVRTADDICADAACH